MLSSQDTPTRNSMSIEQEVLNARLKRLKETCRFDGSRNLANFAWDQQDKDLSAIIVNWLTDWSAYHFNGGASPLPILHLWGARNLGKSHIASGLGRFFGLNFGSFIAKAHAAAAVTIPIIQWISWSEWCKGQLKDNTVQVEINEKATLLVLDDIDSYKPVSRNLSTWAVEDMNDILRRRCEELDLPTVITGNWNPTKLENFFAKNSSREFSDNTIEMASKLTSIIQRNSYATVQFTGKDLGKKSRALRDKDQRPVMRKLGFNWLEAGMLF